MRAATVVLLTMSIVSLAGCKSPTEKQFEREQVIIAPRMDHDPTDRVVLKRWWANDNSLLRLDTNAAYALFDGHNRFAAPIERGRWSQHGYAVLWLEPYNTLTVDPRRVSISKIDGQLALIIPDRQPMFAMDQPPQVIEDRMVGQWRGPLGTLTLRENFMFTLEAGDTVPTSVTSQQLNAFRSGSWHVAGDQLVLTANVPGIDSMSLPIATADSPMTIAGPGGLLTMAGHKTASNSSQEEK